MQTPYHVQKAPAILPASSSIVLQLLTTLLSFWASLLLFEQATAFCGLSTPVPSAWDTLPSILTWLPLHPSGLRSNVSPIERPSQGLLPHVTVPLPTLPTVTLNPITMFVLLVVVGWLSISEFETFF